nr:AAA family ATPase [uncultured Lachnoclostridium sp.]
MYYTQDQIDRANQADLVSFLQSQGEPLERAGQEYRWKRHDSLTIRGNKWYRHSQSKGGAPIDFVMEFFGKSFTEAVELLTGEKGAAPPPDRPSPAPFSDFRLPPRSRTTEQVKRYLTQTRRIDEDVTGFFLASGDIYEEADHHNAVFVGRDKDGVPRYAHQRGTAGNFRLDVKGSDKAFNFCYRGEGERLFVFEAPIDLLSFLCLFKKGWQKQSYLSLGGVGEKALLHFLSDRSNIKIVYLCLDSDQAGTDACNRLVELMPEGYTVHRLIPLFKDWNEVQVRRGEITDGKYLREAVYGLKEPPQEETVEIIRMSEVDTQTVAWLWKPYIPFGKVTIVQGNPGEGKTTFALRLAAACTTGGTLPGMEPLPPFQVIYQTAEDGLGDTVKPRLIEAAADLDRVLVIDEAKQELTLSDERIEKAIVQTGVRLIILDPIQAYMGEKADMNRANEVRPIFRRLADVAERTGCAVILIGHLNKAAGGQSAYRGLGSIDFRAAARSVLLIGRVKREPNVRVIVHDKSSLAPEGKPVAFCLDPDTGFSWIGDYDITAEELLSGAGGNTATKTEQAERLILDLLSDGKELASEEIVKAAAEAGISERTLKNARRNLDTRIEVVRRGNQWYYRRKEIKSARQECNP